MIGDGLPVEAFGIDKRIVVGAKGITSMRADQNGIHVYKEGRHLLLPYQKCNYVEFA